MTQYPTDLTEKQWQVIENKLINLTIKYYYLFRLHFNRVITKII